MNGILRPWRIGLIALTMVCSVVSGCRRTPPDRPAEEALPPAYLRNRINDPSLHEAAEQIRTWALQQIGAGGQPLYSRAETPPPVQTVQPYGVGVFQQEPRLSVILTTGTGWDGLKPAEKEAKVTQAFREFSKLLGGLKREPALRPTLIVQTPQGMELTWINHLDPSGKNVHGDE
ncbi:MAG TPA: hypothetical protein VMF69_01670 [Gemmataceae bacterium]|nr:hypothetical protein [Gemmataceae bacterium]